LFRQRDSLDVRTKPKTSANGYIAYYRVSTDRQGESGLAARGNSQKTVIKQETPEMF
jgi:hypothetical protein